MSFEELSIWMNVAIFGVAAIFVWIEGTKQLEWGGIQWQ